MNVVKRIEPFVFYLLVLVHAWPVFMLHFFPTVDGPAHLYNSNLINNYFNSESAVVRNYFEFNSEPEPNWLGHILLCIFNLLLPSFLAEKLVMLLYIVSLPVAFRLLIKKLKADNILASYFIFPFIYTFLFYLGFYNFCLSISLLFFIIYYWHHFSGKYTAKTQIIFSILLLLLYFAHLFSFLLFVAIVAFFSLVKMLNKDERNYTTIKTMFASLLPYIPPFLLTVNFLVKKTSENEMSFLPFSTLATWLKESALLITLNHDNEYYYTTLLTAIWVSFFIIVLWSRIKNKTGICLTDSWMAIACFILIGYFILPDDAATGGYISMRILLFFFLVFIFWLSIQAINKLLYFLAAFSCVTVSLILLNKHYTDSKLLSSDASEMYTAVDAIEEGKNVLPLNYSANWMHANFSNYLGSEKNIIVLDNYEAAKPHFPLKWRYNKCPYDVLGDFANSNSPCITLERYENTSGVKVDYITRWHYNSNNTDSCALLVNQLLKEKFEKVYASEQGKIEVFKRVKI